MLSAKSGDLKIAVIGLGYVGLPLALAFAEKFKVIGYDINEEHLRSLREGKDKSQQVTESELLNSGLSLTSSSADISECSIYIITVPTPVDELKQPDLSFLKHSSTTVGKYLKSGDLVIYESTVYPGCTEEDCVPELERSSGLEFNKDFFCGYSPERISPGDNIHTLKQIVKVTSGSTPETADYVDWLYREIIEAGTHKAPSIKVAEASKAIENAQRDVNISFMNELSLICDRIGIDTTDVIDAASTKWNFLKFKPGLVGGHCIGVDPYYLAFKAEKLGYDPQVILSGRRVNDYMGTFVVNKVMKLMTAKEIEITGSKALILGITFKENCADVRNTRVVDIYNELKQMGIETDVYDPWADPADVKNQYGFSLIDDIYKEQYQAVILAVCHKEFDDIRYSSLKSDRTILFDTKSVIDRNLVDGRL
jgi:UDP-N-acetyl-D-galactosamine dehydrogenase